MNGIQTAYAQQKLSASSALSASGITPSQNQAAVQVTGATSIIGALTATPSSTNGISNNSLMYTSAQPINQVSAMGYFTGGSITASNLGQLNGMTSNTSNLAGWNVNTTSISSPNGNISLDSQNNSITVENGYIGGWNITTSTITSPNGNIVLDGANNRIVLYELGVPTIVIQG